MVQFDNITEIEVGALAAYPADYERYCYKELMKQKKLDPKFEVFCDKCVALFILIRKALVCRHPLCFLVQTKGGGMDKHYESCDFGGWLWHPNL